MEIDDILLKQSTKTMKDLVSSLNKSFDNRYRIGIMTVLSGDEEIDFNTLKQILDITDGNLASHLKALEREEIVEVKKQLTGRRITTSYTITENGHKLFKKHIKALQNIIKDYHS